MPSTEENKKIMKMVRMIRANAEIHRWDLVKESGISIRDYNQLKSYMEHCFDDQVIYNKHFETWEAVNPIQKRVEVSKLEETKNEPHKGDSQAKLM